GPRGARACLPSATEWPQPEQSTASASGTAAARNSICGQRLDGTVESAQPDRRERLYDLLRGFLRQAAERLGEVALAHPHERACGLARVQAGDLTARGLISDPIRGCVYEAIDQPAIDRLDLRVVLGRVGDRSEREAVLDVDARYSPKRGAHVGAR